LLQGGCHVLENRLSNYPEAAQKTPPIEIAIERFNPNRHLTGLAGALRRRCISKGRVGSTQAFFAWGWQSASFVAIQTP